VIEVGSYWKYWKYNIGDVVLVVVENTTMRLEIGDVPGVIIKRIDDPPTKVLEIQVSTLLRIYTQLTPLELELL
jgi:hypothetical protein